MPHIRQFFDIHPDLETQEHITALISKGVSFRGATTWILITAILIASLGLNVNSTAVIIGAMLISPLMGPIIGMGLAVGTSDFALLKRSLRNYAMSTLISIATATIYFLLTPFSEAQSELLARTSPTLYDVFIAFVGGAAGIIALCVKDKGNVLPGVAIATALMPPLCTAGFGLAEGRWGFFFGAAFLYFINTVFIALATFFGVKLMGFEQHRYVDTRRKKMVRQSVFAIVIATLIPAFYMTWRIVRQSFVQTQVNHFVRDQLTFDGSQVMVSTLEGDSALRVVLVGRSVPAARIAVARQALLAYSGISSLRLHVIQGGEADSVMLARRTEALMKGQKVPYVPQQPTEQDQYIALSQQVGREVAALYPEVRTVGLTPMTEWVTDSARQQRLVLAVVQLSKSLSNEREQRLRKWLNTKVQSDSLRVVTLSVKSN